MAATGWRITDQVTDQVQNTRAGATVTGVMVYFITGEGNEGSVFIVNQHYNAKNVRRAVQAQADLLDEIGGLAHGTLAQGG
jgi:hypothetical protein